MNKLLAEITPKVYYTFSEFPELLKFSKIGLNGGEFIFYGNLFFCGNLKGICQSLKGDVFLLIHTRRCSVVQYEVYTRIFF